MLAVLRIAISSRLKRRSPVFRAGAVIYRFIDRLLDRVALLSGILPLRWLPTVWLRRLYFRARANSDFATGVRVADAMLERPLTRTQIYEIAPVYSVLGRQDYAQTLWRQAEANVATEPGYSEFLRMNARLFSPFFFGNYGHVAHMELYLRAQELGLMASKDNVFLGSRSMTLGSYLLEIFADRLRFESRPSVKLVELAERFGEIVNLFELTDGSYVTLPELGFLVERAWYECHDRPAFALPAHFADRRREFLAKRGGDDQSWWVTFHVRSRGDQAATLRDATLENYLPAMRDVIARGGWVIRLGDPSMPSLPAMERSIDLPHADDRTPDLDIAFMAGAIFAVGVNSGPAYVPGLFDRPALLTNWPNLGNIPWYRHYRLLPRHARWIGNEKELSLRERCSGVAGQCESVLDAESKGVIFSENSSEEILTAVQAMFNPAVLSSKQRRAAEILSDHSLYPLMIDENFMNNSSGFLN